MHQANIVNKVGRGKVNIAENAFVWQISMVVLLISQETVNNYVFKTMS